MLGTGLQRESRGRVGGGMEAGQGGRLRVLGQGNFWIQNVLGAGGDGSTVGLEKERQICLLRVGLE